jgi:iron(III) transport system permease protein
LGGILAMYFAQFNFPGKRFLSLALFLPLFVPPYLLTFAWVQMFRFFGAIGLFGLTPWSAARILPNQGGVIFLLTLAYFPISFFLLQQAMHMMPQEFSESASLYHTRITVYKKIILPSLIPSILIAFFLTFILTFITFDVPSLLNVQTYVIHIFKLFNFQQEVYRALYLSSIPVIITGIFWSFLLATVMKNKAFFTTQPSIKNIRSTPPVGITFFFSLLIGCILLATILPLLNMYGKSNFYEDLPYVTKSFESVVINTVWLSVVSSIAVVCFSILVYLLIYRHMTGRIILLSQLIIPSITFGILFIQLFNHAVLQYIYITPLILILAYCLRFAPIVCEILYAYNKQINPELLESVKLVPGSMYQRMRVLLPLYKPALFTVWAFSLWFVITELPITLLLQPPGFQTMISRLYILLHYGTDEVMSMLSFVLMGISVGLIFFVRYVLQINKAYDA